MTRKNILTILLITVCLLLIPLVAMQFTEQVNWTLFDFAIAGALLFGTGVSMLYIFSDTNTSKKYKIFMGLILTIVLLLVWAELAVGIFN